MEPVDHLLAELIEALPTTPGIVVNARWDVLAANPLATAVSPSLQVGVNLAEATFVNLSAHRTLADWDAVSARMVGLLKEAIDDPDAGDSPVESLRAGLAGRSSDFITAWTDGAPPDDYALAVTMDHPEVGRIDITYEILRVPGAEQTVVLGHVVPGSTSEKRLFELAARSDP